MGTGAVLLVPGTNFHFPIDFWNVFFTRLTILYQVSAPSKCPTKIAFPFDTSSAKKFMKSFWLADLLDPFRSFHVNPFIVWINWPGHTLLAIDHFNALMISSVVWSGSNSKRVALVKLHVKRSMYTFFSPLYVLRYIIGHGWICKICTSYKKRSWTCSSVL